MKSKEKLLVKDDKNLEDLEILVKLANEQAKELGLTLYLDPAKIIIDNNCPVGTGARHNPETDSIIIFNGGPQEDFVTRLVHEGCHQKFMKEVAPFCHPRNSKGQSYWHKGNFTLLIFNEGLAYATSLICEIDNPVEGYLDFVRSNILREKEVFAFYLTDRIILSGGAWCSPELSYAMMKAHKSGMSMDKIFNKAKGFLTEPYEKFSFYEVAKFIKTKLNQDPVESFELGKSELTGESQQAKEELIKKLKEGNLEGIESILDKLKRNRGNILSLSFLKDVDPEIIDEYYTRIIDFYNKNPMCISEFTQKPIYYDLKPAKIFQNKLRKEFGI